MQLRSQRGSAVVFFGLWFGVLMLMLGIVLDGGRLYMTREQMRSALDAAALAGALQFERYVSVHVPVEIIKKTETTQIGPPPDRKVTKKTEIETRRDVRGDSGDRRSVWQNQRYLATIPCNAEGPNGFIICLTPCIEEEHLRADGVEKEARATLALNAPWIQGAVFEVYPANGTVIASGRATVNLHFMRLVGLDTFEVEVSPKPRAQLVPPGQNAPEYCSWARVWG